MTDFHFAVAVAASVAVKDSYGQYVYAWVKPVLQNCLKLIGPDYRRISAKKMIAQKAP
jgi:urease accessory protein UreF